MTPRLRLIGRCGLLLLTLAAGRAELAQAALIIDQSNPVVCGAIQGCGGLSIQFFSPVGQSFTPTLPSLNFFDFYTSDFGTSGNGIGATLEVRIFSGVFQTLLSTSLPVTLPDGFGTPIHPPTNAGLTHFVFAAPVPLVVDGLFSARIIVRSGDNWGVAGGQDVDYAGGTQIFSGSPGLFPFDFWFREGIAVPEPGTILLLGSGVVALRSRHRRLG